MKRASSSRGARYSRTRGWVEATLSRLYGDGWAARVWSWVPGACEVAVVRRTLAILPPGAGELRIGFASDLHIGPTTPPRLLDDAAAKLRGERLDVLCLGGDYVFLEATPAKAQRLAGFVQAVAAPRTFAVMGNHDLWTDHGLLERALEAAGVELLINRNARLAPPHDAIAVVGLDEPWTGAPDPGRAFAGAERAAARIVVCHAPEGIPLVAGCDAALYLCGHTHGGHIALPWGPIYVPGPVGKQMSSGFYSVDGMAVLVSRGLGGIELPIRTFARPDVVVVTLCERDRERDRDR